MKSLGRTLNVYKHTYSQCHKHAYAQISRVNTEGLVCYKGVVTQKWPFLDVFAIHDNVSFSCHKDIVKLNGMTVSVDEYHEKE